MNSREFFDKFYGAWWGAFIGDALAMPTHGYSSDVLLKGDYGKITNYVPPRDFHPESILHTIPVTALSRLHRPRTRKVVEAQGNASA